MKNKTLKLLSLIFATVFALQLSPLSFVAEPFEKNQETEFSVQPNEEQTIDSIQPVGNVDNTPFAGTGEIVPSEIIVPKVSTPITIDGKFESSVWGTPFIHAIARSRAEYDHCVFPREDFIKAECGALEANSDWYFRYDNNYLYICVVVTKPYISQNINGSVFENDDVLHLYLGIDDGDSEGTNDPHCGFGIVANCDCTETWVNCYDQSMPNASNTATVNDTVIASIGMSGLKTIYEVAVPIKDALGYSDLDESDEICLFSGALCFADENGIIGYQVGEGCIFADKKPTSSPLLICGSSETATIIGSGKCGNNAYWSLDSEGLLTISGSGEMTDYSMGKSPWYSYCEQIKDITILSGITSIGDYAFFECSAYESIYIPDTVTDIGDYALYCSALLKSIDIPNTVTNIGDYAFYYCDSLISIDIPSSVTSIGEDAFSACAALKSINVASDNMNYSSENGVLFNKDKSILIQYLKGIQLTEYSIPSSVTKIGDGAFDGCNFLISINIPSSVTYIGDSAFQACTSLLSIDIPSSVISIGDGAFNLCKALLSINIPSSVKSIGASAFSLCESLKTVAIPSSVESISDHLFHNCYSLTSVDIPSSVKSICDGAFISCYSLTSIDIPASVTSIGEYSVFDYCKSLKSINVASDNMYYCSVDGILFNKDKTILLRFPAGKEQSKYTIPASVKIIGGSAFKYCQSLTLVSFEENSQLENINYKAFYECFSLKSISIPSTIKSIGYSAFYSCSSLSYVYFYGNAPSVFPAWDDRPSFAETATLFYISGKNGWYNGWNGYNTATFDPNVTRNINNDDTINILDMILMKKLIAEIDGTPDIEEIQKYDFNRDGSIDNGDIADISKILLD